MVRVNTASYLNNSNVSTNRRWLFTVLLPVDNLFFQRFAVTGHADDRVFVALVMPVATSWYRGLLSHEHTLLPTSENVYFRGLQYPFDSSTEDLAAKSTSLKLLLLPHPKILSNSGNSRLF